MSVNRWIAFSHPGFRKISVDESLCVVWASAEIEEPDVLIPKGREPREGALKLLHGGAGPCGCDSWKLQKILLDRMAS